MSLLLIRSTKRYSGAERYNVELLRELKDDSELQIEFLTNLPAFAKELSVKTIIAPWLLEEVGTKKQLLKILLSLPFVLPKYINVLIHYDVVCFQSRSEMIFLSPIARLLHKKVVWIQHGPMFASQAAGIVKWLFTWASMFADKIIAVSKDTKRDLVGGGVNAKKIEVIYIGVQLPKLTKTSHKQFTVGFLGTVTKDKGIDVFVRMITQKKVNAIVIGDGPDRNLVPKEVKQTGFVSDVSKYVRDLDLLYLPTRHHEGLSMAILEAMSYGIPVAATDIGGNREIIKNGYNGLLLKSGESFTMRQNWKAMGIHARETVRDNFNIQKQAKVFAAFFKNV